MFNGVPHSQQQHHQHHRDANAYVWVDGRTAFHRLVETLSAQPAFALDIESNSMHAYRERICLIQFSDRETDYILDPFRLSDLSPLASLFANPDTQKVLHGASYDILSFKRQCGFEFHGLFDTQSAAQILGWPQTGLAAVLESRFSVRLKKKHQRANWGRRPLPAELLDYARLDTHYLLPLRDLQLAELEARGLAEQAREAFERSAAMVSEGPTFDPAGYKRIKGARELNRVQMAVLRELYLHREHLAEARNLPPFKVLGNDQLLEIARLGPHNERQLATVHGMTPGQVRRYGSGLLSAIRRGRARDPGSSPNR